MTKDEFSNIKTHPEVVRDFENIEFPGDRQHVLQHMNV
jgi:hypothetical protein